MSPYSLLYGSEYRQDDINRALQAEDPYAIVPSTDEIGHGTFLASIAAGRAVPEQEFTGVAPDAELIIVKLKEAKQYLKDFYLIDTDEPVYQETDMMTAIKYIQLKASELKKAFVICIGAGTNLGDHTGNAPISYYMNQITSRAASGIVIGTGNEAVARHHYEGRVQDGEYEDVEIRVGEGTGGFTLELWGEVPEIFSVSITTPTGENIPRIPVTMAASYEYSFIFDRTKVYADYQISYGRMGVQLIMMRFDNPTAGIWQIRVYGSNLLTGRYNMWLPMKSFLRSDVYFLRPTPDITLTEPSATEGVLTVGGYNARTNGIYIASGRGYTRQGNVKPEIAAPAVDVYGVTGEDRFGVRSGSSIATAITTGCVALMWEWAYTKGNAFRMDMAQVKSNFIRGAERDLTRVYPNTEWGYGTLDIYQTFERMRIT